MATAAPEAVASPASAGGDGGRRKAEKRKKISDLKKLGRRDKIVVGLFKCVPLVLVHVEVVFPAIATGILWFGTWNGIVGLEQI